MSNRVPTAAFRAAVARGALCAVLLVGGGAWLGACGEPEETTAAPGFAPADPAIDTTPFTMALPSDDTLPDGFFEDRPPEPPPSGSAPPSTAPTTTAPTTTVPPATTTSQPPYFLPVEIDSICGLTRSIASLFSPDRAPTANQVDRTLQQLLRNLDRYVQVAPPAMTADIRTLQTLVSELASVFYQGERDLAYPPLQQLLAALSAGKPPYERIPAVLQRLAFGEGVTCGGIG